MRIAVVSTSSHFVFGGAEFVLNDLVKNLKKYGNHEVDHFNIPFPEFFDIELIQFTLSSLALNFDNYDMLIASKFPAYCIPHRNKVIWLFHQFRQVYELWENKYGFNSTPKFSYLKDFIFNIDSKEIPRSAKIFSLSEEVAQRLKQYNHIESEILYAPVNDADKFYCDSYNDYIFYPSRISEIKRQHLAIEAMAYVKSNVKLYIAGKCAEPDYENSINHLIKNKNIHGKVKLMGEIPQQEKFNIFSKSLGAIFIPYKEDYGLVTLEAGLAKKATICTTDSGGVREFITSNSNGLVTDPDPKKIAEAMDFLYFNKDKAKIYGEAAYEKIQSLNLNWENIVNRITQ